MCGAAARKLRTLLACVICPLPKVIEDCRLTAKSVRKHVSMQTQNVLKIRSEDFPDLKFYLQSHPVLQQKSAATKTIPENYSLSFFKSL